MQFTSACITVNNYTLDDIEKMVGFVPSFLSYVLIGYEIGENGTPHLQCYCEFTKRPSFSIVKSKFGNWHFEKRWSTQQKAIEYITNNPDKPNPMYEEHGVKHKQGDRTDLHQTVELALTSGMRAVAAVSSNAQQIRHGELALAYLEAGRETPPHVVWIYGRSGSGKSRLAHEMCSKDWEGDWYRKGTGSGKWFPGYDAHKCLWLDDVTEDFFGDVNTYRYLIELTDRYPCWVQNKGGQRQMLAEVIIVTSIHHPKDIFGDVTGELNRRITQYIDLNCRLQEVGGNTKPLLLQSRD